MWYESNSTSKFVLHHPLHTVEDDSEEISTFIALLSLACHFISTSTSEIQDITIFPAPSWTSHELGRKKYFSSYLARRIDHAVWLTFV